MGASYKRRRRSGSSGNKNSFASSPGLEDEAVER